MELTCSIKRVLTTNISVSRTQAKKCHLAKPFTLCMADGFVVDVLEPFEANLNDAQILKKLLAENQDFRNLLQANDVFVLDRGLRDVIQDLEEEGFKVLTPSLKGQRMQLTTDESNHSRSHGNPLGSAVEAVHGVVGQKCKLLHNQFDNKALPNAKSFCKIGCYLYNCFGKRFHSDVEMTDEIFDRISHAEAQNTLAEEAAAENWNRRRTRFQDLTSVDFEDFPEMTEKDLKIFCTGGYKLKQAVSYLEELLDINGM